MTGGQCTVADYSSLLEELGYYGLVDTAYYECMTARQSHQFKQDLKIGTETGSTMLPEIMDEYLCFPKGTSQLKL